MRRVVTVLAVVALSIGIAFPSAAGPRAASPWARQTSASTRTLFGVDFVDATHGWAVGDGGTILRTLDGGAHWTKQVSGTTDLLGFVSFADAKRGWATTWGGSSGLILRTADGGAHWSKQSTASGLWGVDALDATHAGVVGSDATNQVFVYSTIDGKTWTAKAAPFSGYVGGVQFTDRNHGWVAGNTFEPNESVIMKTVNAGKSWNVVRTGVFGKFHDLEMVNGVVGVALSYEEEMTFRTTDRGAHWSSKVLTPPASYGYGLSMVDSLHGYMAVANYSSKVGVMATSDGGKTWKPSCSVPTKWGVMYGVDFVDASHGWAVGDAGLIMRFHKA